MPFMLYYGLRNRFADAILASIYNRNLIIDPHPATKRYQQETDNNLDGKYSFCRCGKPYLAERNQSGGAGTSVHEQQRTQKYT